MVPGTLVLPVRKGDTSEDDISEEGWVELPYTPTSEEDVFSEEGWVELQGLYIEIVSEDAVEKK